MGFQFARVKGGWVGEGWATGGFEFARGGLFYFPYKKIYIENKNIIMG
jgi:hypothetical protein